MAPIGRAFGLLFVCHGRLQGRPHAVPRDRTTSLENKRPRIGVGGSQFRLRARMRHALEALPQRRFRLIRQLPDADRGGGDALCHPYPLTIMVREV